MASRIRGTKILDTLEDRRLGHTPGEEEELRKDVPEWRRPGQERRKIVSPRNEEHRYVVSWAMTIVE